MVKPESSLAKKATVLATSSGRTRRPIGLVAPSSKGAAETLGQRAGFRRGGLHFSSRRFLAPWKWCWIAGDDWFGSTFIVTFATVSATALLLFIPWELSRRRPLIDLHLPVSRQFGSCFLVMLGTGALLIATTQVLPQLLQD